MIYLCVKVTNIIVNNKNTKRKGYFIDRNKVILVSQELFLLSKL